MNMNCSFFRKHSLPSVHGAQPAPRWPLLRRAALISSVTVTMLAMLTACSAPPVSVEQPPQLQLTPSMEAPLTVDETAMLPLIGYAQLLDRMSAQEQSRERGLLGSVPKTPLTQVRMAMLLAQPRGAMDLTRALALLESVVKSNDPVANSVQPLAQVLLTQYNERLKLEIQNDKLNQQLKDVKDAKDAKEVKDAKDAKDAKEVKDVKATKEGSDRGAQLKELQDRNSELQEKLNALTNIERSLPIRPNTGEMIPGTP